MTVKTYAAKSSVTRAMKAQGVAPEKYTIEKNEEGFYAKMIDVTKKEGAQAAQRQLLRRLGNRRQDGRCPP